MSARIHDDRTCALGEGPLWHPERGQLFWFDILGKRMLCDDGRDWQFDEHVSAAGWIDADHLLIASETALFRFNLATGARKNLHALEADIPENRSNDGRADPWGGFWIGTMRKEDPTGGGAIYRFYKGELRQLFPGLAITNAICFAPDRSIAYWADTAPSKIYRVALDDDGWPAGDAALFLDLEPEGLNPDGSVVAADGTHLNAQWGATRVARYGADGGLIESIDMPASQVTCPAFGGPDMTTLFCTSAYCDLTAAQRDADPHAGKTFAIETDITGLPEHQVRL